MEFPPTFNDSKVFFSRILLTTRLSRDMISLPLPQTEAGFFPRCLLMEMGYVNWGSQLLESSLYELLVDLSASRLVMRETVYLPSRYRRRFHCWLTWLWVFARQQNSNKQWKIKAYIWPPVFPLKYSVTYWWYLSVDWMISGRRINCSIGE